MLKNNIELFLKHKNSKKIKNRIDLLNQFPKNSIGIELGVHLGDFSEKILQIVDPKELHLVDAWDYIPLNKPAIYFDIPDRDLFVKKRLPFLLIKLRYKNKHKELEKFVEGLQKNKNSLPEVAFGKLCLLSERIFSNVILYTH